jgi:nitronate monooxygenase
LESTLFPGVRFPLVQAPMAGVQGAALAAAVCEAGGLGSVPAAMLSPEALDTELRSVRALTAQPYNVNFFCHLPPVPSPQAENAWRQTLQPHYQHWGLTEADITPGSGRAPFSAAMAEVLERFRPAVVSFHFGLPAPDLLARVKAMGAQVLSSATTLEEGLWLQANGADMVIAQGLEAGGHRGMFLSRDLQSQRALPQLLPLLAKALSIPVIAAGGIADAQGVAAAMTSGAAGVQVGTAYLTCTEATTSTLHRRAVQNPAGVETALTNVFTGRPARGIVNHAMRSLGPISPVAPEFPLATAAMAPLRAKAEAASSSDFSPLWSGQNTCGCRSCSAADTTRRLAAGFAPPH